MLVNGTTGASKLGLLESSSNGANSGPITITVASIIFPNISNTIVSSTSAMHIFTVTTG
jgi:hypothetical protein